MNSDKQLTQSILWLSLITGTILLIPLIAMQFTHEVVWTLSDFLFAGTLIFGSGLTYKLVTRESEKLIYRAAVGAALATGFILVWANDAVGIIGTEANPINLAYYGVLLIGLVGTSISRLQPKGMSVTMIITALAQAMVTIIALLGGYYQSPPSSVIEILGVNGFFILLWIGSAIIFRFAADKRNEVYENHGFDS